MSKAPPKKKEASSSRVTSSQGQTPNKEASSLVVSASEGPGEFQRSRLPVWPEWSEAEVNAEKWDAAKLPKDAKSGKSPFTQLYEDSEGRLELPPSLKVHTWKRPSEYILNTTPVVVENERVFDLTSTNEHLLSSELMRWIISEIYIVWRVINGAAGEEKALPSDVTLYPWRPWEHIYSLCKVMKGHMPLYNAYGKYVVRLYWMGSWRKITVDDTLPFDEDNNLLLPATAHQSELWPMLLAKAIIKLANTDVVERSWRELGEFTVIHALTGWLPEIIPLQPRYLGKVWQFLTEAIPKYQQTENVEEKPMHSDCAGERHSQKMECKSESPTVNRAVEKNKADSAKKRAKEVDKDRKISHAKRPPSTQPIASTQSTADDGAAPVPQMVVCASYQPLHLMEQRTSILGQMADSSESLRQYGLSQLYSHPVLLSRTRDCPLVAPPIPPPIPRWKLVRPRKEKNITDEPRERPVQKPEQFIEVCSPFINFRRRTTSASLEPKPVCGSNLGSFCEMEESESHGTAHQDSTQHSSLDAMETAKVTAEDKEKDESVPNDTEAAESTSGPEKEKEKDKGKEKERVRGTEKESTAEAMSPVASLGGSAPDGATLRETWVELHHFAKCFQTLLVFHKPVTYPYQFQQSHFKSSVSPKPPAAALSHTSINSIAAPPKPGSTAAIHTQTPDEKGSHFLTVDNLLPTEILICFSALLHWGESVEEKSEAVPRRALLTAEPFSWMSLSSDPPLLHIHTAACQAAMLTLPPGRHVLHIRTRVPLGFHLHLCSVTPFVCGDEDSVMRLLNKESVRFCEQALRIFRALGQVISVFSDPEELPAASRALKEAHHPETCGSGGVRGHIRVFSEAVYHMFCTALGRKLNAEETFAVQALTRDPCPYSSDPKQASSHTYEAPDGWCGREATDQEKQAALLLQASWKGYRVREILSAATPGTKENQKAAQSLLEMWASVGMDAEKHSIALLRVMFASKRAALWYPCREDEWTRTTFSDYTVSIPDTPNSWMLVFREVFYVPEDMLLVPRVRSPLPSCVLHVINNETGEELPRMFNRAEPLIYTHNQGGYTFVAEACSGDAVPATAKWRLRLIGSCEPLPQMARDTPVNNFAVKEYRDYYIPNAKNIICRYAVRVSSNHLATVQFQTSEADVRIKLSILDHEREVASGVGKGHVIIPVYSFSSNSAMSSCLKESPGSPPGGVGGGGHGTVAPGRGGGGGGGGVRGPDDESSPAAAERLPADTPDHKYFVQAEVLHRSWPLDASLMPFVRMLRDVERNEMRVGSERQEDGAAPGSTEQPNSEGQKSATPKSNRKAKEREKEKDKPSSKPGSRMEQSLDVTKPHWVLRVVSDPGEGDCIEVRKDTERLDEIKAMKLAWEAAEPGRAHKALQCRLQFINKHQQAVSGDTPDQADSAKAETALPTQTLPGTPSQDLTLHNDIYNCMKYKTFLRKTRDQPRLKDAAIEEQQQRERSEKIQSFRLIRDTVLEHRKQEQISRRELMRRQIETYDNAQVTLREHRRKMLQAREAFRSRLLEEDNRKREEESALEAARQAELEKSRPQPSARKSGGKRK